MSAASPQPFSCTCSAIMYPNQPMIVLRDHCPLHSPRAKTLRDLSPMGGGPRA